VNDEIVEIDGINVRNAKYEQVCFFIELIVNVLFREFVFSKSRLWIYL